MAPRAATRGLTPSLTPDHARPSCRRSASDSTSSGGTVMRFKNPSHHQPRRPFGSHSWLAVATALILAPALASFAGSSGREEETLSEAALQLVRSNLLPTAPAPKNTVNADLDGKLVYLGSDFEPAVVEPGKPVHVTN